MSNETITGRLLREAQEDIDSVIRANNLSQAEIVSLKGQKLILNFIAEDHAKTEELYKDYLTRKERRGVWEKLSIPIVTALTIGFLTQAIYFWIDIVPKLQSLP